MDVGSSGGVGCVSGGQTNGEQQPAGRSVRAEMRAKARMRQASPARGAQAEHALGWLACPLLNRHVDELERRGGIGAMASVVDGIPKLSEALREVHVSAPALRRWLLPPEWTRRVESSDEFRTANYVLFRTGLIGVSLDRVLGGGKGGGSGDSSGKGTVTTEGGWRGNLVKCLHAQLGDRLVRGADANPVGDLVLRRLEALGVPTQGTDECWRECAVPTQTAGGE